MSFFGSKLRSILQQREKSYGDLSREGGLSKSTISFICNGLTVGVPLGTVEKILTPFDNEDVLLLAHAHLLDEIPKQAEGQIEIKIVSPLHEPSPQYHTAFLDHDFETAVAKIRSKVPKNKDLRLAVIGLANAVSR